MIAETIGGCAVANTGVRLADRHLTIDLRESQTVQEAAMETRPSSAVGLQFLQSNKAPSLQRCLFPAIDRD